MPYTNFPGGITSMGMPVPLINSGESAFSPYYFVNSYAGSDGNKGRSAGNAFATLDKAMDVIEANNASGAVVFAVGNFVENITAPAGIFDVSIIGCGTSPRHGDAHTGNNGYFTMSWRASSQTSPCITLQQQGWRLQNILFDCPTTAAAISLPRNASAGDAERDSSHAQIFGCRFTAGQNAIQAAGTENVFNVQIVNNIFNDSTGFSIVSAGAYAYRWLIQGNTFINNAGHIDVGFNQTAITGNTFGKSSAGYIDLTGGADNSVCGNQLAGTYSVVGGYTAGTNDFWAGNFNVLTGGVTAANPA
jgi:hypothetical protein